MSTSVGKIVAERNHRTLMELVLKPGNDVCADCKARAPRWASYNLGIFICVNCASIHRKIGTHITKVKSITLDEWSKEQVEFMKEKGNIKSNVLYNPDEARHPPPTNMVDSDRDSELEKFIRSKYEYKRFMDRKSGPPSRPFMAASTVPRSRSTPLTDSTQVGRKPSPGPPLPPKTPENLPSKHRILPAIPSHNAPPTRSFSQPLPQLPDSSKPTAAPPLRRPAGQVWEDLVSLQEPPRSSSLPLQYSPVLPIASFPSQPQVPVQQRPTTLGNALNPFLSLSPGETNAPTPPVVSRMSVSAPGAQFPFVLSAPLSSPALHLGATNSFNQAPPAVGANGSAFPTSLNPFSTSPMSMTMSTPTMPPARPVMALSTGNLLHTPPLPFVASQMSMQTPTQSFPSFPPTAFGMGPATTGLGQSPFASIAAPGQTALSTSGAPNPFSAMQMRQAGFSGATPQTALLSHQQQQQQLGPNELGGWAGIGAQGTF